MKPAAKRLKEFIDSTGMSYSEFARQCQINHAKNITHVVTDGKQPTTKLLDKIIKRFPQLNYDWVILGYGEMIVKGMQMQPANASSVIKSRDVSFENIKEYLDNHDYALNYLANKIEKALISSAETFQQVTQRLDAFEQKQVDFIKFLDEHRKQGVKEVSEQLDIKLKEMRIAVESKSDLNTKKAMDFVHSLKIDTDKEVTQKILGEFVKHSNPKPQK